MKDTSGMCTLEVGSVTQAMKIQELLSRHAIPSKIIKTDSSSRRGCVYGLSYTCSQSNNVNHDAGGVEAIYNDAKDNGTIIVDGHSLLITRNVCLAPSTYTLGETDEYCKLLKNIIAGGCDTVHTLV